LNSERIQPFYQLDIRVDKKWFFSRWSLDAYLDIQNVFSTSTPLKPILDVERDENGVPIQNAEMKGSYIPRFIADGSGTLLPSIGLIIEL